MSKEKVNIISGEGFSKISDLVFCRRYYHNFNYDTSKIKKNERVFLNLDSIYEFINILKNKPPKNKFILITHNSDSSFTKDKYELIKKYVNKIYAINNTYNYPNIYTIPIGFRDWPLKTYPIIKNTKLDESKSILIYMNFNILTNRIKRQKCFDIFKNHKWVTKEENLSINNFYSQLSKSKYVLSPKGTGIDCHRIYEALYLNTIPILEKTEMDHFYKKLPVIVVDYSLVTKAKLEMYYNTSFNKLIKWKENNPDWLNPEFWII